MVNLGNDEGPPRLVRASYELHNAGVRANRSIKVTCVKSSQGFDWNQGKLPYKQQPTLESDQSLTGFNRPELFLPSYANNFDAQELEHKQDPVQDIVLSEEDAAEILPK